MGGSPLSANSAPFCKLKDDVSNAAPQPWLPYQRKCPRQCDTVSRSEKAGYILGNFSAAFGLAIWRSFEEERYWNFKNSRSLLQSARADAIYAVLIFLDLLERNAHRIAEPLLAHIKHQPPHPDAAANMLVYWIGTILLRFFAMPSCSLLARL